MPDDQVMEYFKRPKGRTSTHPPLAVEARLPTNGAGGRGKTVTCTKGAGTLTEWTHEFIPNGGHNHKGKVEGQ